MEILCFLAGVLFFYTRHFYLLIAAGIAFFLRPSFRLPVSFIAAILYVLFHQLWIAPQGMPEVQVLPNAILQGTIVSVPNVTSSKTQFEIQVNLLDGRPVKSLMQLAWYLNAPALHAGQQWQLHVKLKQPKNFANPGGVDRVLSLNAKHIYWTGYVKAGENQLLQQDKSFYLITLRESLGKALALNSPNAETASILQALTLGLTQNISQEQWTLFRHTGTTHLMVISGAHIGLVAGLVFWLVKKGWTRSSWLCLRWPAPKAASLAGFFAALLYALIAGFAVPAQRSLVSCGFMTLRYLTSQRLSMWQSWRYAVFLLLLYEPHAVLFPGSYLSFLAVAILIVTNQRWRLLGFKNTLAMQLACLLGLMPLTLYWFSYGSIIGFLANIFAIPLVGFLIVPFGLLTLCCLSWQWSWVLMKLLGFLVGLLLFLLGWVDQLAAWNASFGVYQILVPLTQMSALVLLVILPNKTLQIMALILLLASFFPHQNQVKESEALVRVLDVGQGLSVVVQTQHHFLVYDTGDQFFQGGDMGQLAVLPYLLSSGAKSIDKIVISHPDKDHRGGLLSLEAGIHSGELIVDKPVFYHRGSSCHEYPDWEWDGVSFHFFPIHSTFQDKNNSSCVLQISNSFGRVLLTGDIEKKAEDYLVSQYGSALGADVLVVPHHGSKTSSSLSFVKNVNPRYAVASLGFDNRFHFPHPKIVQLYSQLRIPFYTTSDCGMVDIELKNEVVINCNKKGVSDTP